MTDVEYYLPIIVFVAAVYIPYDANYKNALQECTVVFVLFIICVCCVTDRLHLSFIVHPYVA